MGLEISKSGNTVLVKVSESSLSGDIAVKLKSMVVESIEEGALNIDLDLSETNYIDSSGIGKLLFINKKLAAIGGSLRIPKISTTLYDFLDSLTITKVIKVTK